MSARGSANAMGSSSEYVNTSSGISVMKKSSPVGGKRGGGVSQGMCVWGGGGGRGFRGQTNNKTLHFILTIYLNPQCIFNLFVKLVSPSSCSHNIQHILFLRCPVLKLQTFPVDEVSHERYELVYMLCFEILERELPACAVGLAGEVD